MDKTIKEYGLIRYLLQQGAKIAPLEIDFENFGEQEDIMTSMNPSVWIDEDGTGYVNIRAINYNIFNSRYREFTQDDQPVAYVSWATTYLKTVNYFGNINLDTLEMENMSRVKMLELHEPNWVFIGLEDARIIHWNDKLYLCGVRRDIKDDGEGRMELSEIVNNDGTWTEINRTRMPAAGDNTAYLEKNWMPIVDRPYTWLKWCSPVEIANFDTETEKLDVYFTNNTGYCFRGDSQLVHIGDFYYCFVHLAENLQLRPETNARMTAYNHYILKLNEELHVVDVSESFSYSNTFNIEFGCGLAYHNGYCYLTFAENDSAAFIIKFDADEIEKIFEK